MDVYHSGKPILALQAPLDSDENEIPTDEVTLRIADDLFQWYTSTYPIGYWGTVEATERAIDSDDVPELAEHMGFKTPHGFERFTCKIDMQTVATQEDIDRINEEQIRYREVEGRGKAAKETLYPPNLPGPGRYLWDFKVYQAEHGFLTQLFGPTNIQFTAYQLAASHAFKMNTQSDVPYMGLCALVIIKRKEPTLRVMYCPPPDETAIEVFEAFRRNYRWTKERVIYSGDHFANNGACFNWFNSCEFLENGCERY
jgi:hypothetical protein